jgi:sugar-specific transcriptional regulator TrmB
MKISENLLNLGLTQYEIKAYLALVGNHPLNGSQLSRHSGIPRARIYDVLRSLTDKGIVVQIDEGLYAPLPPKELLKRLRHNFESSVSLLENNIKAASEPPPYDYVWTIRGYDEVIEKAREMIAAARHEIYARMFPAEGQFFTQGLRAAEERGVEVKHISMGHPPSILKLQVVHPETDKIEGQLGGRSFDLVVDQAEILVGIFETGREDRSPINWAKNHWFVVATRDSLRHDFFHYFLYKTYEKKQKLTKQEKMLYELIANDH